MKTQSRIEVPDDGAEVPAGTVRVGGYAWAQHTGVREVEVRVDGRAWTPAELGAVPSDDTWVQWAVTLELAPGPHTLACAGDGQVGLHPDRCAAGRRAGRRHRLALDRGQGRLTGPRGARRAMLWPCATPW